jgi:hypothetical protein
MGTPFFNHAYVGVVPPFVGVAVKVTLVPAHIVVLVAAIDTEGVTVTDIIIGVLIADGGDRHISLLGSITHIITSPSIRSVAV